jgi:hypothetical protein
MASNNDCHPGMATRILQWNVQRSVDKVMAPLLRDPKITGYTVIAIQEPWLRTTTWDGREHIPRSLREFLADPKQTRRSASFMVGTGRLRAPSPADPSASGDAVGEGTDTISPVRPIL